MEFERRLTADTKKILDEYAQAVLLSRAKFTWEDNTSAHFWPLTLVFPKELHEGPSPRLRTESYSYACLMYVGMNYGLNMITRPRNYKTSPKEPASEENLYVLGAYQQDFYGEDGVGKLVKEHDLRAKLLETINTR